MNKFLVTIAILLTGLVQPGWGQLPTPPGTVQLTDSLYIDVNELSNLAWLEYLYYVKLDSSARTYLASLPDNTVWQGLYNTSDSAFNYLNKPEYRYFPVVGITHKQATEYCKWRSKVVTQKFSSDVQLRQQFNLQESDYIQVTYRLPTEEEWLLAAGSESGNEFGLGEPFQKIPKEWKAKAFYPNRLEEDLSYKEFKKRFKSARKEKIMPRFVSLFIFPGLFSFRYDTPVANNSGIKDSQGIYNLLGNVAEMTATPGLAKGGSFLHPPAECTINSEQFYSRPQVWLGFRCVAEVKVIRRSFQ
jgi:formylglycine-generating enzyme required for sulfatase activity